MKFHATFLKACSLAALLLANACSDNAVDPNNNGNSLSGTLYLTGVSTPINSIALPSGTITNLADGSQPYFTKEGTIIARVSNAGFSGLAEYNASRTSKRTIVERQIYDPYDVTYDDDILNPQVSPDGKYIAYEGQFGFVFDVYVVDRQTGALIGGFRTDEIGVGYERPTWTSDGRIVVSGVGNEGLFITDKDLKTFTRFDPNLTSPHQPNVSPDGKTVAFIMNDHLYTIGIDGTGLHQISTTDWKESWPEWSPDGKMIAVYGGSNIYFLKADGSSYSDLRSIIGNSFTFSTSKQFCWN